MNASKKLTIALILLTIILSIGTVGYMFLNEGVDAFNAFYMTVITITTVGFSEITGINETSRLLTIILIFFGFGLISYVLFAVSQMVVEGEIKKILGKRMLSKKISSLKDHIIICGYGRIGEVIASFMNDHNTPFVVVEKDEARLEDLDSKGFLYISGDATSDESLEAAGIKQATKLIAATNNDSQNVFIVLTARELNPKLQIFSRAYAPEAERRLIRAGADKVIFPDNIGGHRIAMSMIRPTFTTFVDVVFRSYEEGQVGVDELFIKDGCSMAGKTLMEANIRPRFNLIIMAIRKKDGEFHFNPGKDTIIDQGDTLIAIGLRRELNAFQKQMNL